MEQKIAIIGASSPFGYSLLAGLAAYGFPARMIYALDSNPGSDKHIPYGSQLLPLHSLYKFNFQNIGLSFLTTSTLLSEDKDRALRSGRYLIDCIGLLDNAPCLIADLNFKPLHDHHVILNPTDITLALSHILMPLHQKFKITSAEATALLSAGQFGIPPVQSLIDQTRCLYTRSQPSDGAFQKIQAFNLLPEICPSLIYKSAEQLKNLLHFPITLCSCLTPIFQGECYSLTFTTKSACSLQDMSLLFQNSSLCRLYSAISPDLTVSTQDAIAGDYIYLTHLRPIPFRENTFHTWVVCDNLKIGSVSNAIRLASHILGL